MTFDNANLYDIAIGLPPSNKSFTFQNEKYIIDFLDNRNWFVWNLHFFLMFGNLVMIGLLSSYLNDHFDINPWFILVLLVVLYIAVSSLFYYKVRPVIRKRLLEEKRVIIKKV